MKYKENQFRGDLDRLFEISGVLEHSKLNHTPFILFNGDTVELVMSAKELLEYPPELYGMVQWRGNWSSDFFNFQIKDLHNFLITHRDCHPELRTLVENKLWETAPIEKELKRLEQKVKDEESEKNLERLKKIWEAEDLEPCVFCGVLKKNFIDWNCSKSTYLNRFKESAHQTKTDVDRVIKEKEEKESRRLERKKLREEAKLKQNDIIKNSNN